MGGQGLAGLREEVRVHGQAVTTLMGGGTFPKTEAGACLKHCFSSSCIMAFAGIINNDAQKEDMAVSLAVLLLKDGEKEISVSLLARRPLLF